MKITRIAAHGLKAGDFEHNLAPVTVFTGGNFRGKTSRLEAVRLALMGYLPELGKPAASTFALCRGGELAVLAEFDTGAKVDRRWRAERGAVKATLDLTGDVPTVPAVLMDPNEYFALGAKDRMRYVFSLAKCEELDGKPVADVLISKVKQIKIEEHNEHHEAKINEVAAAIDDGDRERHEAEQPVQDWIAGLVADMRDKLKLAKQNADRMTKTVQGLTVLKGFDETVGSNVEAKLKDLRGTLLELSSEGAKLGEQMRAGRDTEDRRAALQAKIQGVADYRPKIAELLEKCKPLQDQADAYQSGTSEAHKRLIEACRNRDGQQQECNMLERKLTELRNKHEQDMAAHCCPHCKTKRKGWQDNIIAEFKAAEKKLLDGIDFLKTERVGLDKLVADAQAALESSEELDGKQNDRNREIQSILREIGTLQSKQQDRTAAESALAALPAVMDQAKAVAMVERQGQIAALVTETEQEIRELEETHRAWWQAKQDTKRNAQALKEHAAFAAEVQVLKETVAILEALQADLVKHAFGAILERANRLTAGILKSPLDYRDGEIGRWDGAVWIGHETFSGSEKALAYVAISVAMATESPVKVVLLDELSRFDQDHVATLLERLKELVERGVIDQAVLAGTFCETAPDGVEVVLI